MAKRITMMSNIIGFNLFDVKVCIKIYGAIIDEFIIQYNCMYSSMLLLLILFFKMNKIFFLI